MGIIDTIQNYIILIFGTIVGVGVIALIVILYFVKIKKANSAEEKIDYSSFVRTDSTEYSKFENIVSSGDSDNALGMIVVQENVFVSGIDVQGYNYYGASADERERTMINSIAFFNIVEQPIQLRQSSRMVDISHNIASATEDAKRIEKKLIEKTTDYNASVALIDDDTIIDNDEVYGVLKERLMRLQGEIRSLEWQRDEAKEIIRYMNAVSGTESNMKKINQIMFSYVYNPDEQTEELSKEEIYRRAARELLIMAQTYGSALEGCGCSWSVLTAEDLTNLMRRHYHPLTGDSVTMEQLTNSSYNSLFVASDDLNDIEKERVANMLYEKEQQEFERRTIEARMNAEEQLRAAKSIAGAKAKEYYNEALKAAEAS